MNELVSCYLCGKPLHSEFSQDHVPPRQFYSGELRKKHNLNLRTIPVHSICNRSFQRDEDYFVSTLVPLARGSYSGNALWRDAFRKYDIGERRGLMHKVLREFDPRPAGLALPAGVIVKRIDGQRFHRVAWKILRGLYFLNFNLVLPEGVPHQIDLVPPPQRPPDLFQILANEPNRGDYLNVFDYRYARFPDIHDFNYWALLLWDRIIVIAMFHDAKCTCDRCGAAECSPAPPEAELSSPPDDTAL